MVPWSLQIWISKSEAQGMGIFHTNLLHTKCTSRSSGKSACQKTRRLEFNPRAYTAGENQLPKADPDHDTHGDTHSGVRAQQINQCKISRGSLPCTILYRWGMVSLSNLFIVPYLSRKGLTIRMQNATLTDVVRGAGDESLSFHFPHEYSPPLTQIIKPL